MHHFLRFLGPLRGAMHHFLRADDRYIRPLQKSSRESEADTCTHPYLPPRPRDQAGFPSELGGGGPLNTRISAYLACILSNTRISRVFFQYLTLIRARVLRIRVFVLYSLVSNMHSRIFARCQIHIRYGQIHVRYATGTRIPAESDLDPGMVNVFGSCTDVTLCANHQVTPCCPEMSRYISKCSLSYPSRSASERKHLALFPLHKLL